MDRRDFLRSTAGLSTGLCLSAIPSLHAATERRYSLDAAAATVRILDERQPELTAWAYNQTVPGPELRVRQGERLAVAVTNHLDEGTTVHWHGVRLPNGMDGVPHLTQPPIAPNGGRFVYAFAPPDAGTYWYHPHSRSYEQVDRGLYGALIVEERASIAVDRDVVWVLDDWRLDRRARVSGDFGDWMDASHAGRIGNVVTVNGMRQESFAVRAGERVRLRLINAANARIFALRFSGHRPWIVALDGHPVEPHEPEGGAIVLGPSMRVDLVLDLTGKPGERHAIDDHFYRGRGYRLLELGYTDEAPLRSAARGAPMRLPANPVPEPDVERAERHEITLSGGMMGGGWPSDPWPSRAARRIRQWAGSHEIDPIWAMNGVAVTGEKHDHPPAYEFKRGAHVVLRLSNETAWFHPMHLHGHAFRVVAREGRPTRYRPWQDSVLIGPRETADIAFVADNPGLWMLHCHVLEHQASGMMSTLAVA